MADDTTPTTTTLYYSASREPDAFEAKIRANLVAVSPWPIISVSQKPLTDCGTNVCVGDVGMHDANGLRQLQIGAELATTPFVALAEADALYPPEYFKFIPPFDGCWRYANVWILSMWRPHDGKPIVARRKRYSECAQIIGRDFLLAHLAATLAGRPYWSQPDDIRPGLVFRRTPPEWTLFDGADGVVNVKTGRGLRWATRTITDGETRTDLPRWGNMDRLQRWLAHGTDIPRVPTLAECPFTTREATRAGNQERRA